jgi:hypothetical protein
VRCCGEGGGFGFHFDFFGGVLVGVGVGIGVVVVVIVIAVVVLAGESIDGVVLIYSFSTNRSNKAIPASSDIV